MPNNNRNDTQARDGQVIVGITKDLQNVPTLLIAGQAFTPQSLVGLVQSRIDSANAVVIARAQYLEAVKAYKALNTKLNPVIRGLRQYVYNAFGETSPKLADFGFTPPKRATQTAEQKAEAAKKRAATRKARNTMGKKQRLKVTGDPTPPATPPAPATPPPAAASAAVTTPKS